MALVGLGCTMKGINFTKAIGKATVAGLSIAMIGTATESGIITDTVMMTGIGISLSVVNEVRYPWSLVAPRQ